MNKSGSYVLSQYKYLLLQDLETILHQNIIQSAILIVKKI